LLEKKSLCSLLILVVIPSDLTSLGPVKTIFNWFNMFLHRESCFCQINTFSALFLYVKIEVGPSSWWCGNSNGK